MNSTQLAELQEEKEDTGIYMDRFWAPQSVMYVVVNEHTLGTIRGFSSNGAFLQDSELMT